MPKTPVLTKSTSDSDSKLSREMNKQRRPKVKLSRNLTARISSSKTKLQSLTAKSEMLLSPERKRRKNQLDQLQSTLSPEYIGFGDVDGKRSRYGRAQRHKEDNDFLPTQIACYVRRSPTKVKYTSATSVFVQKPAYESPINKLIEKNKLLSESTSENPDQNVPVQLSKLEKSDESLFHELGICTVNNETSSENSLLQYSEERLYHAPGIDSMLSCLKSPSSLSTDSAKGSSIDLEIEFPVRCGDMFWARISPFPYWPCIVWPDPGGRTIVLNNNKAQKQNVKIHVRFFGDNGRRGWVHKSNIFPFCGRDDFVKRSEEYLKRFGKRHSIYRAFDVNNKRKSIWEKAVIEADEVEKCAHEDRQGVFENILEKSRKIMATERHLRRSIHESRKLETSSDPDANSQIDRTSDTDIKFERDANSKRDRSPDLADINEEHPDNDLQVKRLKLDQDNIFDLEEIMHDKNEYSEDIGKIFKNDEFDRFHELIRKCVFKTENFMLEKYLEQEVKRIWYLRYLANANDSDKRASMNIRKLSLNYKELMDFSSSLSKRSLPSIDNLESSKSDKKVSKPIEEVVDDIMDLGRNYLFRGLNKESVCKDCRLASNLLKCDGKCQSFVHKDCSNLLSSNHVTGDSEEEKINLEIVKEKTNVLCKECSSGEFPKCFVCKKNEENMDGLIKCHVSWCPYHYHLQCLKYWPQSKITRSAAKVESLLCSAHVCHTCVSDDPRGKFFQIEKSKLVRCVECPATYHSDSFCIPAGTKFLTATQIICPRHGKHEKLNINANWCFICATGGSLICCDTCPTAFHLDCLKIPQPDGNYICEECETGRLPLYGELVWAKLGNYRWWPSIIIPPPEVPKNLLAKKHEWSEFCIRFFGSNDHAWINRNRVFLYQEGDWGKVPNTKGINQSYKQGLEEARRISELLKKKKQLKTNTRKDKGLAPLPYIKIKFNRSVPPVKLQELDIGEITACECSPADEDACGPYSGCLNRLLVTECNPKICPAGPKCQNQLFEKRLYPPLKVYWTNGRGWGLFGEKDIKSGAFVIEYVGEVIDDKEFQRRIAQKQEEKDENYYFLTLEKDYIIDAGPKGNLARFMNHSCEPNCETQKWTVNGVTRIGLFALIDIPAKTELTFNYNLECLGDNKKICHCGSEKCSGFIGSKYKENDKLPVKAATDTKPKPKGKSTKRSSRSRKQQ